MFDGPAFAHGPAGPLSGWAETCRSDGPNRWNVESGREVTTREEAPVISHEPGARLLGDPAGNHERRESQSADTAT